MTYQLLAFSRKQVIERPKLDLNSINGQICAQTQKMLQSFTGEDIEVSVVLPAAGGTVHADPHNWNR